MKLKFMNIAVQCYYYSIPMCINIKRGIHNKYLKYCVFAIAFPILLWNWLTGSIIERTWGRKTVERIKREDESREFDHELAIVAIAKNEGKYIEQWLAYHKSLGISKVYLYDNESDDNLKEIVKPYIDSGFVDYKMIPGQGMQLVTYNDAIKHHAHEVRYFAVIDCDEYLMPAKKDCDFISLVKEIFYKNTQAGGIGVNWCVYGSAGKQIEEDGFLAERFTMRAEQFAWNNHLIKCIVNPRLITDYISPHFPIYMRGAWTVSPVGERLYAWYNTKVSFNKLRCNHYFCKSVEEFQRKQARGLADRPGVHYDMTKFDKYNRNDEEDLSMMSYINDIKANLL